MSIGNQLETPSALQFLSGGVGGYKEVSPAPASYNPDNRFVRQTEPSIQIPQIFHNGEDEQVDTYLHILFHTDIYFQKQGGNNFNILPIYLTGCIEAPSAGTGSFPGIHHLKSFTQVMQLLY